MNVGYEIECCLEEDTYHELQELHSDDELNYFKMHGDGSVRSQDDFEPCEFSSNIFTTRKKFNESIEYFIAKVGDFKNFEINRSCGFHFHVSLSETEMRKLYGTKQAFIFRTCPNFLYIELRKYFFKNLETLNIDKTTKESIKKQYFRDYAKKFGTEPTHRDVKYCEFYPYSDCLGMGLEWRSLNILGVKSWDEYRTILYFFYDCLKFFVEEFKKFASRDTYTKELKLELTESKGDTYECVTLTL